MFYVTGRAANTRNNLISKYLSSNFSKYPERPADPLLAERHNNRKFIEQEGRYP